MLYRPETSFVLDRATYPIPPGTEHPEFVVPTDVTDFVIRQYGLADPRKRVIDPFAGNGDFMWRIIKQGGRCDGIELDPAQYELAMDQMPTLLPGTFPVIGGRLVPGGELLQGDCTQTAPRNINIGYNAVYTSPPFTLMHELARSRRMRIAQALNMMVLSDGGVMIIDSADEATRDGRTYSPASDTIKYLTGAGCSYADGYFNFITSHKFKVNNPPPGCDSQFTELVFAKRFPYYPGALAGLGAVSGII